MVWLGEEIPLGDAPLQPGVAFGARMRIRPLPMAAVEMGIAKGPRGEDVVLDALGFLGEPVADVVAAPLAGVGVRFGDEPRLLLQAGLAVDLVLTPFLDLRPDVRMAWTEGEGLAILLNVGLHAHLARRFDRDADGVSDRSDRCADVAEDRDGFLDADGCPDPDNDQDNVADLVDACRSTPEDRDGFLDADGCPEPDNDGDGLFDDRDACINDAEDRDGFRDPDGCPDPDNDGDGVLDLIDGCPNVAEDPDGFEDGDGCPDPDNDGDGVGDRFDLAPDLAENINFFEDTDGSPEVLPPLLQKVLGAQRRLRFSGTELTEGGAERAELLAAALAEYPEVRVRLVVSDFDMDRALKKAITAAAAVVVGGVVAERIEPEGEEGEPAVRVELLP